MSFVKIQDFENYSINILGNVRNDITNRILKQSISSGYYRITLPKNNKNYSIRIHRLLGIHFLPNPDNKLYIDHIDNNKLNNSIDNLRWCNHQDNMRNKFKQNNCSSIYKGVHYCKINKKWISKITINKKNILFGQFNNEKDAGRAYNNYIIENNLIEYFKLNSILP